MCHLWLSGNYRGQPYSQVVRFPTDESERDRWIKAMPNAGSSLTARLNYMCVPHILTASGLFQEEGSVQQLLRHFFLVLRSPV